MVVKALAKGMVREYQIDYNTAKKILQNRSKRTFHRPEDFRMEKILKGVNGNGNGGKREGS